MSLLNADTDMEPRHQPDPHHEPDSHAGPEESSRGAGKGLALAFVIAALAGGNLYLLNRVDHLQQQTASLQMTLKEEISGIQQKSSVNAGRARQELEGLRQQIEDARQEAAGRAQREARRQSDQVAKSIAEQQQRQGEQYLSGIHDVRTIADEANNGVQDVRTGLGSVRSDLAETDSHLRETASLLDQTTQDLGEVNGMVNDNSAEIASLRRLTERNRVRFALNKSKDMQKVADIQLRLRDTDVKHHRYTVEILADDTMVVKKDRQIAEPVMFYLGDTPQPYELVVTKVDKDAVRGYLAKPTVEMARR